MRDRAPYDAGFARSVTRWQGEHGRHGLPWQQDRTAYRVWLSEVMLQQTQVATVIPYFETFTDRFSDVVALADAPQSDVMTLWSGLGYYSRARNLHRCAQRIRDEFNGEFPTDFELLQSLPGIGRSTAAAISVFALGQRQAILDGNVKRVFCRRFGVQGELTAGATINQLWELAEQHLPKRNLIAYTQGLMDLGATCCTRTRPACERCPVRGDCVALARDQVAELPRRTKRKRLAQRRTTMLVIVRGRGAGRQVWLTQRPDRGIWGGLLSLPESSLPADAPAHEHLRGLIDQSVDSVQDRPLYAADPIDRSILVRRLPVMDHAFTHFKLRIEPLLVEHEPQLSGGQWLRVADAGGAALPAPVKKLLTDLT